MGSGTQWRPTVTTKPKPNTPSSIPDFASHQEAADFWDAHDFTDFDDETTPAKLRVRKPLDAAINVRLDSDTWTFLQNAAAEKGFGPTTLARMWLIERVRVEEEKDRDAGKGS